MKLFNSLLFVSAILLSSCSNQLTDNSKTNLTATEFSDKIKATPTAQIVDVRTQEEYANGHLQNAINFDWNGDDFDKNIAGLDKTKASFVYCLSGGRSSAAAKKMRSEGFTQVYELKGGIMKWRSANLPESTEITNNSTGMSKEQFEELLLPDKIILIDFYADWCGPCKQMKPYLDEISTSMVNKVKVIRINADENQALCKELKIDALPILHLYKNKVLIWENTGFIEKEKVVKEINKL